MVVGHLLQEVERAAHVHERLLAPVELAALRALDAMQDPHRLRDGLGDIEELLRDVRVRLQRVERGGELLSGRFGELSGVRHPSSGRGRAHGRASLPKVAAPSRPVTRRNFDHLQPVGGGGSLDEEDEDDDDAHDAEQAEQAVIAHGLTLQFWTLHDPETLQVPVVHAALPQNVPPEQPSRLVEDSPHDTEHDWALHDCAAQLCTVQPWRPQPVLVPGPSTTSAEQPGPSASPAPASEIRIKLISDFMTTSSPTVRVARRSA